MKRYLWELYAEICSWKIWPWRIRNILYAFSGISIGRNTAIHSGCLIIGRHLIIGNGSYINSDCMFESSNAFIEVGDCVGIAYNCNFYTTHHEYSNPTKRTGRVIGKTIKIGDGVWIGGGVTVCPGVTIGNGCIIAAGSVVIHDCEADCLYGGNPAKKLKQLNSLSI